MNLGHDLLLLFVGAVITILINYFTNYTSNPLAEKLKKYWNNFEQMRAGRSVRKARKRIDKLKDELYELRKYYDNPAIVSIYVYKHIIWLFYFLFGGIITLMISLLIITLTPDMHFSLVLGIPLSNILPYFSLIIFARAMIEALQMGYWMNKVSNCTQVELTSLKMITDLQKDIDRMEKSEQTGDEILQK
jgi:hypothetical protein